MIGLVDVYLDLWRDALNAPCLGARYTARLAILTLHVFVVVLLAGLFVIAAQVLR